MWKVDQILQLFAPFECLNCGREGGLLCHECGFESVSPAAGRCYRCLKPAAGALCPNCQLLTGLQNVAVASSYQGLSAELISRIKFARTQAAAQLIAKIMDARLPASPIDTIVVHVPTANQRVRQRGYDQAQLIAREFAQRRQLSYQPLLRRHGHARQLGANRQVRQKQLQAAFWCPKPGQIARRKILLVDDVLTTGSTIEAAARAINQAGPTHVSAVLFAQKL